MAVMHKSAEISKFLGISNQHVLGIAGMGDLVATCFSPVYVTGDLE